jgi:hypothetical protein
MWRMEWDIKAAFVRAGHQAGVGSKIRLLTDFLMTLRMAIKHIVFTLLFCALYWDT